ncbi:MAG: T9SS type A sorting domain-containing protein [Flavobacterium sp.]|nr:T9SS type A sorting domain-containing protein [Flavobacterium sp.]
MKKTTFFSIFSMLISFLSILNLAAQPYSNGGLSTGVTSNSGVSAPSGYTWSEAQNQAGVTTVSNSLAGSSANFNNANTSNFLLADDFVVPVGQTWDLTSVEVFGYQTGYTGTTIPVDQLRVQIFNGDPSLPGSTLVFGDLTTNRLNAALSGDALMYRIFNSTVPTSANIPGTTRKIWRFNATTVVTLQPGTYWLVYQVHATNDGALFFPPLTIPGIRGLPSWNAKQRATDGTWASVVDTGTPVTTPSVPMDMPFNVNYSLNLSITDESVNSISVYPNPASNAVYITGNNLDIENILVSDLNGRVLKSFDFSSVSDAVIDLTELTSAVYIITIKSNEGTINKKIIKQ